MSALSARKGFGAGARTEVKAGTAGRAKAGAVAKAKGEKDPSADAGTAANAGGEKVTRLMHTPAQIMAPRLLFIVAVVLLAAIGLVMVYSASSIRAYSESGDPAFYVKRQAVFLCMGVVACIVMARVPYRIWGHPAVFTLLWTATTILLVATQLGFGSRALGADRSIVIAGFALQPAEFAKITVIVSVCSLFAMLRAGNLTFGRFVALIAIAVVIPVIAIFRQPDLGTVVILVVGLFAAAILAGMDWRIVVGAIGVFVLYFVFVCIVQPYHLERIETLLDPWKDPSGSGYQTIQSLYALALGGVQGSGLGLSQEKYLYLPYAHTDFIFAVIGEEFGLAGTATVVLLFALFAYAGMRICRNAPDLFGCMLAGSLTVMVVFQACVNMGCVIGLLPVTGKALPFLSYGGSSLLATCIMAGLVLSVSFNSQVDTQSKKRRAAFFVVGGRSDDDTGRDAGDKAVRKRKARQEKGRFRDARPDVERAGRFARFAGLGAGVFGASDQKAGEGGGRQTGEGKSRRRSSSAGLSAEALAQRERRAYGKSASRQAVRPASERAGASRSSTARDGGAGGVQRASSSGASSAPSGGGRAFGYGGTASRGADVIFLFDSDASAGSASSGRGRSKARGENLGKDRAHPQDGQGRARPRSDGSRPGKGTGGADGPKRPRSGGRGR